MSFNGNVASVLTLWTMMAIDGNDIIATGFSEIVSFERM